MTFDRAADLLRSIKAMLWPLEEAIRTAVCFAGGATVVLPRACAGGLFVQRTPTKAEQMLGANVQAGHRKSAVRALEPISGVILQGQQERIGAAKKRHAGWQGWSMPRTFSRLGVREAVSWGWSHGPSVQPPPAGREILNDPDQIAD